MLRAARRPFRRAAGPASGVALFGQVDGQPPQQQRVAGLVLGHDQGVAHGLGLAVEIERQGHDLAQGRHGRRIVAVGALIVSQCQRVILLLFGHAGGGEQGMRPYPVLVALSCACVGARTVRRGLRAHRCDRLRRFAGAASGAAVSALRPWRARRRRRFAARASKPGTKARATRATQAARCLLDMGGFERKPFEAGRRTPRLHDILAIRSRTAAAVFEGDGMPAGMSPWPSATLQLGPPLRRRGCLFSAACVWRVLWRPRFLAATAGFFLRSGVAAALAAPAARFSGLLAGFLAASDFLLLALAGGHGRVLGGGRGSAGGFFDARLGNRSLASGAIDSRISRSVVRKRVGGEVGAQFVEQRAELVPLRLGHGPFQARHDAGGRVVLVGHDRARAARPSCRRRSGWHVRPAPPA